MTTSRSRSMGKVVTFCAGAVFIAVLLPSAAMAQATSSPVVLDPISPGEPVDSTTVHNMYGKCGSAVVQVLGVKDDDREFYTVDSAAENADIVVIRSGGRSKISLKKYLSDYNGVACVTGKDGPRLLVWGNCAGSACGDNYSFLIVDPEDLEIASGADSDCNSLCAARALGSDLPLKLDHLKVGIGEP